jgi:NTE family protein
LHSIGSMALLTRLLDPNNLRPVFDTLAAGGEVLRDLREDGAFVRTARRVLFPNPRDKEPLPAGDPFAPPASAMAGPSFQGRAAVVASGGSGATAATVGVQRAFEEAGLAPVAIAACSGAVLFGAPWACGLDAAQIAGFWLSLPRQGYLDPDWASLLRSGRRAFGGWAGLLKGEALERAARTLVGNLRLGETRVPFSMPAWNIDLNRVEILGTRTTPELEVATAMRVAIAIPIFVEPVRVGEHLYGDGGVVNIFPVRPVLEHAPDLVVGLNSYLPENFSGEDVTGWHQRSFAIVRASGQLRWSGMVALAREQALLAGDRLELLHPVPYDEVRGGRFYETFVDRTRWPRFIRAGQLAARSVLAQRRDRRATG